MYDDEGYYVMLPDPETLPAAGYENMSIDQRNAELDQRAEEYTRYWNEEARRQQEETWYMTEYWAAYERDYWDGWNNEI